MITRRSITYSTLIGCTAALFALCAASARAQVVLFSSFSTAAPASGGGVSGINNFNGNQDWSADTFTLSAPITDPTIEFWTVAIPVGNTIHTPQDVNVQVLSGSKPTSNDLLGSPPNQAFTYAPASSQYALMSTPDPGLESLGRGTRGRSSSTVTVSPGNRANEGGCPLVSLLTPGKLLMLAVRYQ